MQKQTNGATKKFSAKEAALIAEANAKAQASGKVIQVAPKQSAAAIAQTARSTKVNGGVPVVVTSDDQQKVAAVKERVAKRAQTQVAAKQPVKVTQIKAAPAAHATEKAPHTKRALEQAKLADKVSAAADKLNAAKAALETATQAAVKAKRNDPTREAKFLAKAQAEAEVLAAQKAWLALKREGETPEQKAARQAKAPTKTVRQPKVATNRSIAKGGTVYSNAKGGWTLYMVNIALAHKSTDEATAAHKAGAAKAGQPASKPLDFKWMAAKGYIVLG